MVQRLRLKTKLTAMMVLVSTITLLTALSGSKLFDILSLRRQAAQQVATIAEIIADNSTAAILFNEPGDAQEILAGLRKNSSITRACIYNDENVQLATYRRDNGSNLFPNLPVQASISFTKSTVRVCQGIHFNNKKIGSIFIESSLQEIHSLIKQSLSIAVFVILISVVMAFAIAYQVQKAISAPIERLAETAQRISKDRDYSVRVHEKRGDEIGLLYKAFNEMLNQTQDYSLNLEEKVSDRTQELSRSLEELQATQEQLIESEKLAALGGLVAGVAHEINTPVGIGITAASTFRTDLQRFLNIYRNNRVKRSDLERFIKSCTESNQFIISNLNRAAALIHSFKQVAIDQTSEEKRTFNVKQTIQDTFLSLRPKFKKTQHTLKITGMDKAEITSYPGLFSQLITNLLMNSLVHAFDDNERGTIEINLIQQGNHLIITYSDNGIGIAPDVLPLIFEPFFTTERSGGGSGLGLHIVYNIVSQNLKGRLTCKSTVDSGTSFTITIPID